MKPCKSNKMRKWMRNMIRMDLKMSKKMIMVMMKTKMKRIQKVYIIKKMELCAKMRKISNMRAKSIKDKEWTKEIINRCLVSLKKCRETNKLLEKKNLLTKTLILLISIHRFHFLVMTTTINTNNIFFQQTFMQDFLTRWIPIWDTVNN